MHTPDPVNGPVPSIDSVGEISELRAAQRIHMQRRCSCCQQAPLRYRQKNLHKPKLLICTRAALIRRDCLLGEKVRGCQEPWSDLTTRFAGNTWLETTRATNGWQHMVGDNKNRDLHCFASRFRLAAFDPGTDFDSGTESVSPFDGHTHVRVHTCMSHRPTEKGTPLYMCVYTCHIQTHRKSPRYALYLMNRSAPF